ncbi:MAG: ABC transporter permease [Vicinamibacteraceae bacterium]
MLRHILRFEWRPLVADRTVALVAGLFSAVLLYGAVTGAAWTRAQASSLDTLRESSARRVAEWREHVSTTPPSEEADFTPASPSYIGARQGQHVLLPISPLASVAIGQSDLYVNYYKVTSRTRESFIHGEQIENPLTLMIGHFDLAFVILYFYPLLILAVMYDLTSGDRDSGTLRMLLSQPLRLRTFVLGRLSTRAVVVVLPALLIPIVGIWLGDANLDSVVFGRLLIWTMAVLGYGACWFALAVAINALARPPSFNALALAAIWLLVVVLVPGLINIGVASAYPVPSRVEFVNATRAATDQARVKGSQLLSRFFEDHPTLEATEETMQNFDILQAARDEDVARQLEPVIARYKTQLAKQHAVVSVLRFLSPAAVAQSVLYDAAGTSLARYQHFFSQVDSFHEQWKQFFEARGFRGARMRPVDFDRLPTFTYAEEPLRAVVRRTWLPLVVLWTLAVGILLAALVTYRRYAVA